jgi:hypothetical protein
MTKKKMVEQLGRLQGVVEKLQVDLNSLSTTTHKQCNRLVCGASGHKFYMEEAYQYNFLTGEPRVMGRFKCSSCGLAYNRELTAEEIRNANALGYNFSIPEDVE